MIEPYWDGFAADRKPGNNIALGFVEGLNNKSTSGGLSSTGGQSTPALVVARSPLSQTFRGESRFSFSNDSIKRW